MSKILKIEDKVIFKDGEIDLNSVNTILRIHCTLSEAIKVSRKTKDGFFHSFITDEYSFLIYSDKLYMLKHLHFQNPKVTIA